MHEFDITIIGGGVVGNLLALQLSQRTPWRVALVEAQAYQQGAHPGFDSRVIALSAQSVAILGACQVPLSSLLQAPIKHIQVSDQRGWGLCELDAERFGLDAFGQVVSLQQLGETLHAQVRKTAVSCIMPAVATHIEQQQDYVQLAVDTGASWRTKLLVLADGGRSSLAPSLGFVVQQTPYTQVALTFNLTTTQAHQGRAYERFTPHGPLAFLPFAHRQDSGRSAAHSYSVVWCVASEDSAHLLSLPDHAFVAALQKAFGWRQGSIEHLGERHAYPLQLQQLDRCYQHRVVAVGNAAQTLHPIAGQGFNLGLRDVTELVECLRTVPDPGAFPVLRHYAQTRHTDKARTVWLTDGLLRLFSTTNRPLQWARNLGLSVLAASPAAQQAFVTQTTGYGQGFKETH